MVHISKKSAMMRGLKLRCPKCDGAPLFKAYLKPVESCASCGHDWSRVRADDGPPWATMLIVLHVLAPLFHILVVSANLSIWTSIAITSAIALAATFWTLPRMKGFFIGLIWVTGAPTSIDDKGVSDIS